MIAVSVHVSGDLIGRLTERDLQGVTKAVGTRLKDVVVDTMRDYNSTSDWWRQAQGSVDVEETREGAIVMVRQRGVKLHWKGSSYLPDGVLKARGNISPVTGKPTKTLSVPTESAPKGLAIKDYGGVLCYVPSKRPGVAGVLVQGERVTITRGKNKGKQGQRPKDGGDVMYILMRQIKFNPHPDILPTDQELRDEAEDAARISITRRFKRKQ